MLANPLGRVGADVVAVAVASVASFLVHRQVTFAEDSYALIDHRPRTFAAAMAPAALCDIGVFSLLVTVGDIGGIAVPKVVALGFASLVRLVTYRRVLFAAVRSDQVRPVGRSTAPGDVRFSVVIPAYRSSDRIGRSVEALRTALAEIDHEIVVVDDGSGDETPGAARAAGADQVLELAANSGKGAAVRAGMLSANGRTIAFTDDDLSYRPQQLVGLLVASSPGMTWSLATGGIQTQRRLATRRGSVSSAASFTTS